MVETILLLYLVQNHAQVTLFWRAHGTSCRRRVLLIAQDLLHVAVILRQPSQVVALLAHLGLRRRLKNLRRRRHVHVLALLMLSE